jgi:nitrite reductase/ring-hydroxylating ferredoxin subunit
MTTSKAGCLISAAVSFSLAPPKTVALMMNLVMGWISAIPKKDVVSAFPEMVAREIVSIGTKLAAVLHWFEALPIPEVPGPVVEVLEKEVKTNVRELATWVFLCLVLVQVPCFCFFMCCCSRSAKAQTDTTKEKIARKRLTKLRANSKLFPAPYPNGWYVLCKSEDVPTDKAIPVSACGKEFAVFRGKKNGKVGVLDAFCPHLGTHLGHGGHVKGDGLVCPYHSWTFDKDGNCLEIPYCNKDLSKMNGRVNTKSFVVRERLGLVFVWHHADGAEPSYELTILDEIEEKGMIHVSDVPCEDWNMHIMEPSQNSSDPYHFNTVHNWLGAEPGQKSLFWVRHECKTRMNLLGHTKENGEPYEETVIDLQEKCAEMWFLGLIPLPKAMNSHYTSGAVFQGCGVSTFNADSKHLGSVRVIVAFTPQAPFVQRCTIRVFCTPSFPKFIARFIGKMARATINQDRPVWENKLAIAPRNVVAGDGPFAAYGQWLRQFYSESSGKWGDLSIEW